MLKRPFARFAALVSLVSIVSLGGLAGCSSDSISGPSNGSFTATLTGDIAATLNGSAEVLFFPATTTGTTSTPAGFIIGLVSNAGPIIEFQLSNTAALATGTYQVAPGKIDVLFATDATGNPGTKFTGNGGTVTITAISGKNVTGSFNVTATSDVGAALGLKGTFSAVQL